MDISMNATNCNAHALRHLYLIIVGRGSLVDILVLDRDPLGDLHCLNNPVCVLTGRPFVGLHRTGLNANGI